MAEKICILCGKLFSPNHGNQTVCSKECVALHKRELNRKNREKYRELLKEEARKPPTKQKASAIEFHILRLQRQAEARALGLSYAQYIAQKGIKEI